jgi:hypothetical protein
VSKPEDALGIAHTRKGCPDEITMIKAGDLVQFFGMNGKNGTRLADNDSTTKRDLRCYTPLVWTPSLPAQTLTLSTLTRIPAPRSNKPIPVSVIPKLNASA